MSKFCEKKSRTDGFVDEVMIHNCVEGKTSRLTSLDGAVRVYAQTASNPQPCVGDFFCLN